MSSFWPMSFSISRWKLSSTVWQSGQGVTMVLAPLVLADWMCCPVSLIAMRSSWAAVWKPQHSVRPL